MQLERPGRLWIALGTLASLIPAPLLAHGVSLGDKGYIQRTSGTRIIPFMYLGAKHMVTGYDHLLFLAGVIFYLFRLREIGLYVSLFAIGHTLTLLTGVLTGVSANAHVVDAIIGLSVVYKALDNLGAYQRWFGFQPATRTATFLFGLAHGFGLATKLLDFEMGKDGLVSNLVAFNVGVEFGQLFALGVLLVAMSYWRRSESFIRNGFAANVLIMAAGFVLIGYQLAGYAVS